jgi:hypothetical protein
MPDIATRIANDFSFHPATDTTAPKHDEVRRICREAALALLLHVPEGRELSLAITSLQEAMMWANAGVA